MLKHGLTLVLFTLFVAPINSNETGPNPKEIINRQSQKLAKGIETESLQAVLKVFAHDTYLLPEYHKMLSGLENVTSYFEAFFKKAETISYKKEPFEIQQIDGLYLELGTFEHQYKTPTGNLFDYNGKYLTCWKLQGEGTPKIVAHIWGASSYFEAENLNFIDILATDSEGSITSTKWEKDIEEVRKYVYQAVLDSDAKKQIESYADDAIYMTYYDPPFIGKEKISEYYYSHYNPVVNRDSLMTRAVKVIDLGTHALKFGEYHVEWTSGEKPYFIKGKGISLYKRRDDGKVEIYRQMINHSIPPTPRKN